MSRQQSPTLLPPATPRFTPSPRSLHARSPHVIISSNLYFYLFVCFLVYLSTDQCAKDCTYTYDGSLTKCNQQVSDVTKNTYGANLDACANIASGVMDDCMVSELCSYTVAVCLRVVVYAQSIRDEGTVTRQGGLLVAWPLRQAWERACSGVFLRLLGNWFLGGHINKGSRPPPAPILSARYAPRRNRRSATGRTASTAGPP